MPKRNAKGQYVKTHRSGGRARRRSTALAVRENIVIQTAPRRSSSPKRRHHHVAKRKHHGRRRSSGGGGIKLTHVAIAAAGLSYLTSDASPIKAIPQYTAMIPGAKTFGNTTMAGLACLAADRFVKRNRWLRLAGIAGVVAGALQVGAKGTDFKWLGDAPDDYVGDVNAEDMEL